ncbi:T9SS type A sorting domain-containing protein, partial [candidate division GN15 bacterium]|nr:T9SS type A sorting domain-containing protein [candidate division GN15 bacterium]
LLYYVEGVSSPVVQPVCLTVSGDPGPDTTGAWVTPDTIFLNVPWGQTTPEVRCTFLGHWDDTSSYVAFGGDITTPLEPSGPATNVDVCVSIDPALAAGATLYIDEVTYIVSEVDTAVLTIWLEIDKPPRVHPDDVFLTVQEGSGDTTVTCGWLTIENAPTGYSGSVLNSSPWLTLLDTEGTIPDTVCVSVDPGGLAVGDYADTVVFEADNALIPATWVIHLEVVDTIIDPPVDSASAAPASFSYTVEANAEISLSGCTYLSSTNAPADYFAEVLGGGLFTALLDSVGMTNDTVCFSIEHSGLAEGFYCDTLLFYVNGVDDPAVAEICLTVEDSGGGGAETAALSPTSLEFFLPVGPLDSIAGGAYLTSSNDPAGFTAQLVFDSTQSFTSVLTPSGTTDDSVRVAVSSDGLSAGVYYDSVAISVDGVGDILILPVILHVEPSSAKLSQNVPNPFNPETRISFSLSTASEVRLEVFNVIGQRVTTLIHGGYPAGEHQVVWRGTDDRGNQVASGIYLYRLSTPREVETRKMVLMK